MSEGPIVGIDLGTTFSAVAYINRHGVSQIIPSAEGPRTTPSVIYFQDDGSPVVGQVARAQALSEPARTIQFIKREMGNPSFRINVDGKDYVPEALSAIILGKLKADAEAFLDEEVGRAVISVPAYFKDSQRSATKQAGELAGLEVVAIVNEPTAAALAYGFGKGDERQSVLVYDFGGGTFDVTVLLVDGNEFTVVATDGDSHLGGMDVDEQLVDFLAEQYLAARGTDLRQDPSSRLDLWSKAEIAKIDLSNRERVMVMVGSGADAMRVDLDRDRLYERIADLLGRTETCMQRAIESAGLAWPDIGSVLLVGGSSRLAAVGDLIRRVTGVELAADLNRDECVALGAAIRGSLSAINEKEATPLASGTSPGGRAAPAMADIVVHDVAPHSLGVKALSTQGRPVNSIIIPRLTEVPCERRRTYATRTDNQASIEIEILQGEAEDPFSPEVEPIGRVSMKDLPARAAGGVIVAVTLRYDDNGVVEVAAEELVEGRSLRQQLLRKSGELAPDVVASIKRDLERLSGDGGCGAPPGPAIPEPAPRDQGEEGRGDWRAVEATVAADETAVEDGVDPSDSAAAMSDEAEPVAVGDGAGTTGEKGGELP